MGMLSPKVPKPPTPANPAITAVEAENEDDFAGLASQSGSLISTAARGLQRRATTQRKSLIGN